MNAFYVHDESDYHVGRLSFLHHHPPSAEREGILDTQNLDETKLFPYIANSTNECFIGSDALFEIKSRQNRICYLCSVCKVEGLDRSDIVTHLKSIGHIKAYLVSNNFKIPST
jgi:hypothetical protein